jgi:hypothetical protein
LCLAAGGAGIIGAASDLMARGYLMRQADQQLRGYADRLASRPFVATPLSAPAPGTRRPGGGAFSIEVLGAAGQLVMRAGSTVQPGPAIPAAGGRIPARAGQLVTIPAAVGGSWRVIAEPVHYRARRIPYAYSAEDFSLLITSTARPGLAGTLVVGLDLGSTGQAHHHLPDGQRRRAPGRRLPERRADPRCPAAAHPGAGDGGSDRRGRAIPPGA